MKKNNFGFTLLELLVVVLMIGILTGVALPQYRRSVQRAEAIEALVNLRTIFDAAKRYRSANSEAPTTLKGLDVQFFDADEDVATPIIGNYKYTLASTYVAACRVDGNGNATFSTTYCLLMHYNKEINGTHYRDLLECNSRSDKWKYVCETLAQTCSNGDTAKSDYTYYLSDKVVCN